MKKTSTDYTGVKHKGFDAWQSYAGHGKGKVFLGLYKTEKAAALIHDLYILQRLEEGAPVPLKVVNNLNFPAMLLKNSDDRPIAYYSILTHGQCLVCSKRIDDLHFIKDDMDVDKVLKEMAAGVYDLSDNFYDDKWRDSPSTVRTDSPEPEPEQNSKRPKRS